MKIPTKISQITHLSNRVELLRHWLRCSIQEAGEDSEVTIDKAKAEEIQMLLEMEPTLFEDRYALYEGARKTLEKVADAPDTYKEERKKRSPNFRKICRILGFSTGKKQSETSYELLLHQYMRM